jgi:PAT family beta-lactamase induction signal transducer AmpG
MAKNIGWESFFVGCTLIAIPGMLLLLKFAPWNSLSAAEAEEI